MRKWLNWIGLGLMAAAAASMIAADAFAAADPDPAQPAALSTLVPAESQGDAAGPIRAMAALDTLRRGDQHRLPSGSMPQSFAGVPA